MLIGGLACACSNQGYEVIDNGVVVKVAQKSSTDVRCVRVQVMGDNLIRVSATPKKGFSNVESLVVVPQTARLRFEVEENEDAVLVNTPCLSVSVSKSDGKVDFRDADGNEILAEDARSFAPIEVEGTKAYTVRQTFQSAGNDEALYGLGQHQSDEFNYKGKNEELYQYNTKVSVPFIVSNKNYGILWDSYSYCRFGDARDYSQLGEVFKLYDKDGVEGALTGTYIPWKGDPKKFDKDDPDSTEVKHYRKFKDAEPVVRREEKIYFDHQDRATHLQTTVNQIIGFPYWRSDVTFEGEIEASESGLYRFLFYYAGYTKLYIDNQLVMPERWRAAWNPNNYKFSMNFEAGKRVPIRIEWKPDGEVSYCSLRALSPVPDEEQNKMAWWGEMQNEIDYYFIYGDDMDGVIGGYRTLTGKSQVMPKWAMGFWQCRERYKTQDEIVGTLAEFRDRRIPIDNIVQDWNYWPEDQWGSHEFDHSRFPDPQKMVDDIHGMHGRVMISVWPKFYVGTEHFNEFDEKGWMYRQAVTDSIRDWIGDGYVGSFYDAYSEPARRLFWKQMEDHLYPYGFDAWWMDASEPNIRDCTEMDYRKALTTPTALGPAAQYFNAYALMNAEAIYNGQRGVDPDRRVFLLTRSGFAGLQRYSTAVWSGDIGTRWEDMKAQISAGLNFAISGIPYWTMDIGGFSVEERYIRAGAIYNKTGRETEDYKEWRELNTRWHQFGAFCPLYRSHGQFPYREPWNVAPAGHPAYNSILYYIRLRYSLMPYIYSLAGMTYFNDYTIMRPLVMDFTYDPKVNDIGDQFMFGTGLMVSPVYEYGARSREVYFPEGCGWYDFYTGKYVAGGQRLSVPAPYERIPLYAREGAIIPIGPDMQYSDEKPASLLTLYVYAGRNGAFTIYEDEGVNYNYEKGMFANIPITYDDASGVLTLGERVGSFPGMLTDRTFNVIKVDKGRARPFDAHAKGILVEYDGSAKTVKL